jgi:hypothetical protein
MGRRKKSDIEAQTLAMAYCQLEPPRTLQALAAARGLSEIPSVWHEQFRQGRWEMLAQEHDSRAAETRQRANWATMVKTQARGLELTRQLYARVEDAIANAVDPQEILAAGRALKVAQEVSFGYLGGLEQPDSVASAPDFTPMQMELL